jgi:hypothetical protein
MIQYSPNTRYTAQKIADKVANGAYFYSHFAIESDNTLLFEKVQKVIEKLTLKYSLNLSARQRTYRLNTKKEPIADLIVQKRFNQDIFDFWLLITTPHSHQYNLSKSDVEFKKIPRQRIEEAQADWSRELEREQVQLIQDYYQDHEKFKFVLQKPFLKLDLVRSSKIELVRLSHSNKKSKTYAPTEKSAKNYTWTWRFDEPSIQFFKRKYLELIDQLISNPNKSVGMSNLSELYTVFKHYAVFKGNRHQVGRLLVEAVKYHYKKTDKNFRKMDYYVPLELSYLSRQTNYADDFIQYAFLRRLLEDAEIRLDKEKVNSETYNDLLNKYLV